jgi:hypothetical protein
VGTYGDPQGEFLLDIKAGGKATFSLMGDSDTCSWESSGNTLTVKCNGDAGTNAFTVHDDGSLTGPPGSAFPVLQKHKT